MNDIDKNIIEKIKSGKITKKPKWIFIIERTGLWVLLVSTTLICSATFGVILFSIVDHDWNMHEIIGKTFFEFLMISMPYFWIILLILLSLLIYIEFKKTKTGYRYMPHIIITAIALLSVILGIFWHFLGVGEVIHEFVSNNIPYYEDFVYNKKDVWSHPEIGLISGRISSIEDGRFGLVDWNGKMWEVYASGTIWNGTATNTLNRRVKISGIKDDEGIFSAREVNDWKESVQIIKKMKQNRTPARSIE